MGEEHSPPGNVDCGEQLLKITFSCFARYRQGMLLEVIFWLWEIRARFCRLLWLGAFIVNTMPLRIPMAAL